MKISKYTVIMVFNFQDPLKYSRLSWDAEDDGTFWLDADTGEIRLKRDLDSATIPQYVVSAIIVYHDNILNPVGTPENEKLYPGQSSRIKYTVMILSLLDRQLWANSLDPDQTS